MQPQIRASSIRLSTVATTTRQTQKTDFGTVMRNGLVKASGVVNNGLRVAAPYVPGGAIVSAAIAGANDAAGMGTTRTTTSALTNSNLGGGQSFANNNAQGGITNPAGTNMSASFTGMMDATRSMAEMQASYNLQFLQIQQAIQQDTRQFNMISNIMKTKHDAAKNAVNNVR